MALSLIVKNVKSTILENENKGKLLVFNFSVEFICRNTENIL